MLTFQKFREFTIVLRLHNECEHEVYNCVSIYVVDEIKNQSNFKLARSKSIYIKKNVCLSVRYAFSPCNNYRHQTFHDIFLGPEAGRHGVGITKKGQEGGTWVKFHPGWVYCYLDWFSRDLRKSLTIYTEFSYFYFFKLCGIAAPRSEDDKKWRYAHPHKTLCIVVSERALAHASEKGNCNCAVVF